MKKYFIYLSIISVIFCSCASDVSSEVSDSAQKIKLGWATTNITPPQPVQLWGQGYERISTGVHDSLHASVMAIESASVDMQVIMVSIDVVNPAFDLQKDLRTKLSGRLSGFDLKNLFINATHTHTAPFNFDVGNPPSGVMKGSQYRDFMLARIADAVISAWDNRAPGAVGFAQGTADVGNCRVRVYQDGHAVMYGSTTSDKGSPFKEMESVPDQTVNLMYGFDANGNIKGVVVNVACPSQVVESESVMSSDYWGEVRTQLQSRYPGITVLPQCAPAGDQVPRRPGEQCSFNILTLRATAIRNAVVSQYDHARDSRQSAVVLKHTVLDHTLTPKPVYSSQGRYSYELHAIRIGTASFANSPFELYIDYGRSIKNQAGSTQEFLIQLSGNADDYGQMYRISNAPYPGLHYTGGGYLPTVKAVQGGAYGSQDGNGFVGPTGGDELVNQTVSAINSLF